MSPRASLLDVRNQQALVLGRVGTNESYAVVRDIFENIEEELRYEEYHSTDYPYKAAKGTNGEGIS